MTHLFPMPPRPPEIIVDSFAGGGGASAGIEAALGRSPDVAINIDIELDGRPISKAQQVRCAGNSVPPPLAEALVRANVPDLAARPQTVEAEAS
jgi:site-specific DNA-cytosine methylase